MMEDAQVKNWNNHNTQTVTESYVCEERHCMYFTNNVYFYITGEGT